MGEKSKKDSYKYYVVHGTIYNMPLGILQASNVAPDKDPLEVANESLAKRGMLGNRLVEYNDVDSDINSKEVETTFLYKRSSYIDLTNVAGMPTLIFHPDGLTNIPTDELEPSIGIGFGDRETAERALMQMIKIIQHFQKETLKEKKENSSAQ